MKYSIITPVYNSFDLMKNYFESLENQTFQDFEILLIDDCSKDSSYAELKKYQSKSPLNIRVFQTPENSGPGSARNIGLENAKGDWVTFVDNDDWVKLSFLEEIDSVIRANDTDCVIYDYYIKKDNSLSISRSMLKGEPGIVSVGHCIEYVTNHACGKFYKRVNLIKSEITFPKTRRCEDVAFVCSAISAGKNAFYYKKPLYYYCQRHSSLSNNAKLDEHDMILAFDILKNKLEETYPAQIREKSVRDLLYGCVLMMCKAKKSDKEIKQYILQYEQQYPDWPESETIRSLGRSKRIFLMFAKMRMIKCLKLLAWVHTKII